MVNELVLRKSDSPSQVIYFLKTFQAYKKKISKSDLRLAKILVSKSPRYSYEYCKFLGKRDKDLELIIQLDFIIAVFYSLVVIKGRWKEIENDIIRYSSVSAFELYLTHFNGRWVDREPDITKSVNKNAYLKFLKGL